MDTTPRATAERVIRDFLRRAKKDHEAPLEANLYADGIGLDSLETAELSALLEDELGSDPFSTDDDMPETLGAALDHYGPAGGDAGAAGAAAGARA